MAERPGDREGDDEPSDSDGTPDERDDAPAPESEGPAPEEGDDSNPEGDDGPAPGSGESPDRTDESPDRTDDEDFRYQGPYDEVPDDGDDQSSDDGDHERADDTGTESAEHGDTTMQAAEHGDTAMQAAETGTPAPGGADAGASRAGAHPDGGVDATEEVATYDPQEVPAGGVGAPDDEEMPLGAHVEEMVRRLGWVVAVLLLVGGLTFPFAERLINFLWYSFMPGTFDACPPPTAAAAGSSDAACPVVYHPLALMFARLKIAGLVGLVAALPVLVYQSYLFMRPGLYPRERRYYLASVPTSLILAGVGVAFAYFLVLPALFIYFTSYSAEAAEIAFGLTETFNLIVMMLGFFALVFQIPLFIMLAVMMGVTSRRWLASRRIYFWGGFATIAFVFSPDPTGMAPILVAVTMIALFEGTLLLLYWTGSASSVATPEALAARRPFAWLGAALVGYLASTASLPDGYYDQLPAAFTSTVADLLSARLTPLVVGGGLVLAYELLLWGYRRAVGDDRVRRTLGRARLFVWPVLLLVGYLASPDPVLLRRVDAVDLAPVEAAGLAVGLVVGYELIVLVQRWRRGQTPFSGRN